MIAGIMDRNIKVFQSDISTEDCETESHLYELLKTETVQPIPHQLNNIKKDDDWEFTPNTTKTYSPKHLKSKQKVSTVRDIRTLFEKDVSVYMANDLEQQQNYLLRKIRDGSSTDEKTRKTAIALLNGDNPISRRSWHMLSNINPEKQKHSKQYVLWHGKRIQVNGSRGGKNKFILNYDLNKKATTPPKSYQQFKTSQSMVKSGLLRNSLKVKFKPGPLGKKKFLDESHQKYQMGNIKLVPLPAPILEISPTYGIVLEPTISNFVSKLRGETGEISQEYAEFAVTVLGSLHNHKLLQVQENKSVKFDLKYKCEQNRILMRPNTSRGMFERSDNNTYINKELQNSQLERSTSISCNESMFVLTQMMNELLDSVEISLNQDNMYSQIDEVKETITDDSRESTTIKEKPPKRKYCELGKLDVTIIKIPKNSITNIETKCDKAYCSKGCVCESLECGLRLKQHCNFIDCMFGCKCEMSKLKPIDFLEGDSNDIIPGILNLDNELNSHMAKEEQKFHQTIVFSGEKSIILKSRKRNCKISSKYTDFYSKLNEKDDEKFKKILKLNVERLPCQNIEPLCMVHNLYKCFCKGKFIKSYVFNDAESDSNKFTIGNINIEKEIANELESSENILRPRLRKTYENLYNKYKSIESEGNSIALTGNGEIYSCARTMRYQGRKYTNTYYEETNNKIREMEKNDTILKERMLRLVNGVNYLPSSNTDKKMDSESLVSDTVSNEIDVGTIKENVIKNETSKMHPFASKEFKKWLEYSYKCYKARLAKGINTNSLGAPVKGKHRLQTWDFILSRYRERKNIFYVSKSEPYRTFLANENRYSFFSQLCINLDDIRFPDLPKYPVIIQNLLTNSTDSENSFCILRGWDHCWELVGSVVKVIEPKNSNNIQKNEIDTEMTNDSLSGSDNSDWHNNHADDISTNDQECMSSEPSIENINKDDNAHDNELKNDVKVKHDHVEKSKWFVMQIENDFTEIQFHNKGFFVTNAGIHRSIRLAQANGKTVKLSRSISDNANVNDLQYGIYAIPCISESCVFIGPYELDEPLGIEVIKPHKPKEIDHTNKKKTRGVWINTNKQENGLVIDNPLAYLPTESAITIESWMVLDHTLQKSSNKSCEHSDNSVDSQKEMILNTHNIAKSTSPKKIKAIKIRKSNEFYHLRPKNSVHKVVAQDDLLPENSINNLLQKPKASNSKKTVLTPTSKLASPGPSTKKMCNIRPVAEIAPLIKITKAHTKNESVDLTVKKPSSNMLVLKPEEINKRILANPTVAEEMSTDVENFLKTSTVCIAPQDVLVISDDENEQTISKYVWVQCCNIENFGYIRAKTNDDNTRISFEFPGFKYSEFYKESDAFETINQVLARKMYIPRNIKLQWQVVRDERNLTCAMLTSKNLKDKKYLLSKLHQQSTKKASLLKPNAVKPNFNTNSTACDDAFKNKFDQLKLIQGLESTSRQLEHENAVLWSAAVTRRQDIINSLAVPEDMKEKMSVALNEILSLNDQACDIDFSPSDKKP